MNKYGFQKPIILLLAICYLPLAISYAAIPHLINYQGRLTDKNGQPLEGVYSLTFRIYDAETTGTLLWEETQSLTIQKGIFNVLLGGVSNLNLPFDKQYYLEIKVGNEVMSPRQRITSAGYAIRAEVAENAEEVRGSENIFPGLGKVGIGTTSPGQKLTVAGTIESTSGGIKFPDGTVQTTATPSSPCTLCKDYCGSSWPNYQGKFSTDDDGSFNPMYTRSSGCSGDVTGQGGTPGATMICLCCK